MIMENQTNKFRNHEYYADPTAYLGLMGEKHMSNIKRGDIYKIFSKDGKKSKFGIVLSNDNENAISEYVQVANVTKETVDDKPYWIKISVDGATMIAKCNEIYTIPVFALAEHIWHATQAELQDAGRALIEAFEFTNLIHQISLAGL